MAAHVPDHKWWCFAEHDNVAEYHGDICYGWYDLNHPEGGAESIAMAMISNASPEDCNAAAWLLGYHPTHTVNEMSGMVPSKWCGNCATNTTSPLIMDPCPNAAPNAVQTWEIVGSTRTWRVERRNDSKNPGATYLYCPCPAWKFGGQNCFHTSIVEAGAR